MGGFTGIYQGIYYRDDIPICAASQLNNLSPQQQKMVSMPDLQPKEQTPEPKKKKVVRRKKSTKKASTSNTAKTPAPAPTTPKKPIPASSVQPRDHLGRFASKAWGTAKAIGGRIGKGVAHAGKSAVTSGKSAIQKKVKRGIKSAQQRGRKKKDLRLREKHVRIRKQEMALGLVAPAPVKKKVIRRRKR